MTGSRKITFFETANPPQHMWSPYGDGYRALWEREYLLKVRKADMDSVTAPENEQYSYHTFVVPGKVKVSTENEVMTENRNLTPIECKVNRGWEVGYWITIDGKYIDPFYQPLRSPFYRLTRMPTNEAPIKFGIVLFQFQRDKLSSDRPNHPGRDQVLWNGTAELCDTITSVDMKVAEDVRPSKPVCWRLCLVPRHLIIDDNRQVVADSSSPVTVDFRQSAGQLPLVRLQVGNDTVGYFSTFLPEVLYTFDPSVSLDSAVTLTLSLTLVADSCKPSGKERPFWSKRYEIETHRVADTSTEGGKQDVH
jgi:hypothetical protein